MALRGSAQLHYKRNSNNLRGYTWPRGQRKHSFELQLREGRGCEEKDHCHLLAGYCIVNKTVTVPWFRDTSGCSFREHHLSDQTGF